MTVLFLSLCVAVADAQTYSLSESAEISLITCGPGESIYSVYGHTAIRIKDAEKGLNYVFNYGMFDFSSPGFTYRFAKGDTYYWVHADKDFDGFVEEYKWRRSSVTEQVLNLSKEEKDKIFTALAINCLPENKTYLYNFFYDNCSTRPRILIENNISGTILYEEILPPTTFRKIIRHCNRNHRWYIFGIELALGAPLDAPTGQKEQLFLPQYLMQAFNHAKIVQPDGTYKNLVVRTSELAPNYPKNEHPEDYNPVTVFWLAFALIAIVSFVEIRFHKRFRFLDSALFLVYGLTGCVIVFLSFISIHPAVFPNYSIIWAHPLHLLPAVAIFIKPFAGFVGYYRLINGAILIALMLGWNILPQEFNSAFFPIVMILCLRSFIPFLQKSKILKGV
ncbi:MAG: DUF4105 domain-containing protein [Prevotella sp.]|nr:DUF4105 domain-containing protein [Prevotella sp.]